MGTSRGPSTAIRIRPPVLSWMLSGTRWRSPVTAQSAAGQVAPQEDADQVAPQATIPAISLAPEQLGDLELILSGAFAPLRGFMSQADVTSVTASATLADGTPWPVPVVLDLPAGAVPADASQVVLSDPETTPLAVLTIIERTEQPDGRTGVVRLAGPVTPRRPVEHGSFRRLMIAPSQARAEFGDSPVLAFATRAPLGRRQIGQLRHVAGQLKARLLLLPLVAGQPLVVREPESLIRATLAAAKSLPPGPLVVPVPLAQHLQDPAREVAAAAVVAAAYGATSLMAGDTGLLAGRPAGGAASLPGAPIPV